MLNKPKYRNPARPRPANDREREISVTVGHNIRVMRAMAHMSQTDLADKLSVTFQQVQKYEKGVNRISAPKLVLMAEIFNKPLAAFFAGTTQMTGEIAAEALPSFGKPGLKAATLVENLPPKMQSAALRVLHSMSAMEEGGPMKDEHPA